LPLAEPAQHRGAGEYGDRGGEYAPCAEAIRHPAADRNDDGKSERVGHYADVQTDRIGAEGSRHLRERRHDDGAVQILHEQCAGDRSRDLHGTVLPKRFFVAANERNQGLQGPVVRSFGHFISGLGIRSCVRRPGTWAGSVTGRCPPRGH
jgi:hypothetical protein